jgi:PPOX class probable FMN-dependent enzyme
VLIEKSPFAALATCGTGRASTARRAATWPGFVRIHDDKTLMLPDRRGNNRIDSLRNIVRDPRTALLFLIPGAGSTLRVNGRAPSVVAIRRCWRRSGRGQGAAHGDGHDRGEIYFQCARAIVRSDLWNPDKRVDPKTLPTPGQILAEMSDNRVGGEVYDREWPERARNSLW